MVLLLLGLSFIILTALGMPISFAVGVSTVFATLLMPGVDNATIVQRMLTAINTFPLLAVIFFVFAAASMAAIIPPSIGMSVYAHVAGNVSIAALFLAGVIPGIMIGLSLMVASFVHGKLYHQKMLPKLEAREKIRRVIDGFAGVFT